MRRQELGEKFPLSSFSPRTAKQQSPGVQQGPGCGQDEQFMAPRGALNATKI